MSIADEDVRPEPEAAAVRSPRHRTVLMCRPEHFAVVYRINPWMDPARPTDTALAVRQWEQLRGVYLDLGFDVELIDPLPGLPDMVYAANGGFVLGNVAYGASFVHPQRRAEGPAYLEWFRANGFETVEPAEVNEGEGDFLVVGDAILAGTGFRSTDASHRELEAIMGRPVLTLRLTHPDYYHLDTALTVLDETPGHEHIAYLPSAFDEPSRTLLRERFPDAILVAEEDAAVLGLNAFSNGRDVVIAARATGFAAQLREHGYTPIGVDLSELLRGGGGVKCCTLELRRSRTEPKETR
ncbi:N-dimethylarginine dimethylaminohydrolase [Leifsonia sp. F6_8S_P_1B]|uniref:N-dimethylarginine dimethylaminohydrolase n=1 Tax=Leifsonia williamsii TaxID=3035919 RepID=A0ABT8K8B2_9MICO|nr:dimethylargininase [Leifsonia williamsii]MDN4613703.1 N-dimethylarginine dimethylaminohydrolase [Leifsonia williamsii]